MIPDAVVNLFEQLLSATSSGRVALAPVRHKKTGETHYVLALVTPMGQLGTVLMAPWGQLFHEDERDNYEPPSKDDMIISPGFEHTVIATEPAPGVGNADEN